MKIYEDLPSQLKEAIVKPLSTKFENRRTVAAVEQRKWIPQGISSCN